MMWEDLTVALCGIGFVLGLVMVAVGLMGTLWPEDNHLPSAFR